MATLALSAAPSLSAAPPPAAACAPHVESPTPRGAAAGAIAYGGSAASTARSRRLALVDLHAALSSPVAPLAARVLAAGARQEGALRRLPTPQRARVRDLCTSLERFAAAPTQPAVALGDSAYLQDMARLMRRARVPTEVLLEPTPAAHADAAARFATTFACARQAAVEVRQRLQAQGDAATLDTPATYLWYAATTGLCMLATAPAGHASLRREWAHDAPASRFLEALLASAAACDPHTWRATLARLYGDGASEPTAAAPPAALAPLLAAACGWRGELLTVLHAAWEASGMAAPRP